LWPEKWGWIKVKINMSKSTIMVEAIFGVNGKELNIVEG
jgi:hypothetical protein